jgi:hypothetical protein
MSYRLAQARDRLRERLVHRGVGVTTALLGPMLAAHATSQVPAALAETTAKAAPLFAAGELVVNLVSPRALELAEGLLRAMEFIKTLFAMLFMLIFVVSLGTAGLILVHSLKDDTPVADNEPGMPLDIKALDNENRIAIDFNAETQRFGIACTKLKTVADSKKPKLLTSDPSGLNNNTRIKIDGFDYRFGYETPNTRWYKDKDGKLWKAVKEGERKWVSIMEWKNEKLRIKQSVEIVVGEQTYLYDTALVKYAVENVDGKPHTVGLRLMLDTYIGGNDGVPFLVPPSATAPAGQLLDTMAVFEKEKVPPFLRALESADPNEKNATVAELGLKLNGLEPLSKVVLCRWPKEQGGSQAAWDWKYEAMNADAQNPDSCVVMYWDSMNVKGAEKRTLGFTYGLGHIADGVDKVPMRLLAGGPTRTGRSFTITIYVKGAAGEKVVLKMPEGMTLAEGQKAEQVFEKQKGSELAQVSWRVQAAKPGKYTVVAALSTGRETKLDVHVRENSIFD